MAPHLETEIIPIRHHYNQKTVCDQTLKISQV